MLSKKTFLCPYCFERHPLQRVEYRCSQANCKEVEDIQLTRYMNNNRVVARPTFSVPKPIRFGVVRNAHCPECGRKTRKVICPSCHNALPESTIYGKDLIISIVGSRDSGKSHFVGVIIHELRERVLREMLNASMTPFEKSGERYRNTFGQKLFLNFETLDLTRSSLMDPENGAYIPLIYSIVTEKKFGSDRMAEFLKKIMPRRLFDLMFRRFYTIVFFDTAGEDLNDQDTMSTVNKYICKSDGIILLLDPTKFREAANRLDDDILARTSAVDWRRSEHPSNILGRISKMIRDDRELSENRRISVPIAVVLSKMDAIVKLIPSGSTVLEPSPHCREQAFVTSDWHNVNQEVQSLLEEWKEKSFLDQVDLNYTRYSYFAVSALGLENTPRADRRFDHPRPHRIEDPILWILSKNKKIKTK